MLKTLLFYLEKLPLPTTLLHIRFIQLLREFQLLGWVHKALFFVLLLAAIAICHSAFQNSPTCWYVTGLLWLTAVLVQLYRPDKAFIFLHLAKPRQTIFAEYAAISLPFILPAAFSPNWYCALIFLAGLIPITSIRTTFSAKTRFTFIGNILPPTAFEWISGFRKNLLILLPVYVLALAFSWVKILPLVLLWLFFGITLGFYQLSEPLIFLRASAEKPAILLRRKILETGTLLLFLSLPVILLQTIFHPWLGLAGLAFLLLQFCVLTFAILLKYSTYEPNKTLSSNLLLLSFAQLSVVIPFFLLLPMALVFRQYKRAIYNLNFYLPPC